MGIIYIKSYCDPPRAKVQLGRFLVNKTGRTRLSNPLKKINFSNFYLSAHFARRVTYIAVNLHRPTLNRQKLLRMLARHMASILYIRATLYSSIGGNYDDGNWLNFRNRRNQLELFRI